MNSPSFDVAIITLPRVASSSQHVRILSSTRREGMCAVPFETFLAGEGLRLDSVAEVLVLLLLCLFGGSHHFLAFSRFLE